ncbi:MAG: dihydrodipicolinate reductase C-terminal domain-containing protein, partial [Pseudomonadales bacterium]|nr:dihydrodipicolinate reductase C-terminal domain-containing protein [Pseudomonadales bacterium]
HKVDAPSGTAYALLQAVKAGRQNASGSIVHGREGLVGARPSGEIGLHAIRGGDIIGEHQVLFAMNGERIELTHRAASRSNFAEGALRAARWGIAGGAAGLFDMRDVLGLDPAPSD